MKGTQGTTVILVCKHATYRFPMSMVSFYEWRHGEDTLVIHTLGGAIYLDGPDAKGAYSILQECGWD